MGICTFSTDALWVIEQELFYSKNSVYVLTLLQEKRAHFYSVCWVSTTLYTFIFSPHRKPCIFPMHALHILT